MLTTFGIVLSDHHGVQMAHVEPHDCGDDCLCFGSALQRLWDDAGQPAKFAVEVLD